MLLVDTSVWVEVFRRPSPVSPADAFEIDDAVTCLPVIQEVLQGFRDERAFLVAREAMSAMPIVGAPVIAALVDRAVDILHWEVRVLKLGRASVQLEYRGLKDGTDHLKIVQTIVFMDLDKQVAVPIPEDLRSRIEEFLVR